MKIALACSQFPPTKSGYARISFELYEQFRKLGHEVDLVTEGGRGCSRGFARMAVVDSIGRATLEKDHDILQIVGPTPRFSEQCVKFVKEKKPKTKIVYTINAFAGLSSYHDNALTRLVDWAYKQFYLKHVLTHVDMVVFNTDDYARFYKYYKGEYGVIPYGYNAISHEKDEDHSPKQDSPEFSERKRRVLFVGQLRPYKGIPFLIKAIKEIRDLGYDAYLDIVGEGSDASKLRKIVDKNGLVDRVSIREGVSDDKLVEMYRNADVFVLPSVSEPESFGIVLVEAASYGLPIVASGLPGVRELAKSLGATVVSPRDIHGLAQAIVGSFGDHLSRERDLDRLLSPFSWETIAKEYIALYGNQLYHEKVSGNYAPKQTLMQNFLGVKK